MKPRIHPLIRECKSVLAQIVFVSLLANWANAATIRLKPDGTGDVPDLTTAMDVVADGDTILLAPGVYTGVRNRNVGFNGANVTVTSESGPETTIIDCLGILRAFRLENNEDSAIISGLTIRNGYDNQDFFGGGAAIFCFRSAPIIENCVFINCNALDSNPGWGGAIKCVQDASVTIRNCVFVTNTTRRGGAISCEEGSDAVIENNVFFDNSATEQGGAIYSINSSPVITNNTIHRCRAPTGAGIYFGGSSEGGLVEHTIISYAIEGAALTCESIGSPTVFCSVLWANEGGNSICGIDGGANLSLDPLYCGKTPDSLTIHSSSPCAPSNSSCGVLIGALPVSCGTVPIEPSTWGRLKGLYEGGD